MTLVTSMSLERRNRLGGVLLGMNRLLLVVSRFLYFTFALCVSRLLSSGVLFGSGMLLGRGFLDRSLFPRAFILYET